MFQADETLHIIAFIIFNDFYLFIFREGGREGEREEERHQCVVATHVAPTGELAHNPGMCPDWESNRQPLGSQPVLNPPSATSQEIAFVFLRNSLHSLTF